MNKIISNFQATLTYILHFTFFTLVAVFILASITLVGILDLPYVWITAEKIFIAEQRGITAILSSGLFIALIFDAGIYTGRWIDRNQKLKKTIEQQPTEESHDRT